MDKAEDTAIIEALVSVLSAFVEWMGEPKNPSHYDYYYTDWPIRRELWKKATDIIALSRAAGYGRGDG